MSTSRVLPRTLTVAIGLGLLGAAIVHASANPIKGTWSKTKVENSCRAGGGIAFGTSPTAKGNYGCGNIGKDGTYTEVMCKNGKCTYTVTKPPPGKPKPK